MMKAITKEMRHGALVWGIGVPFLLAFHGAQANGFKTLIFYFCFFMILTGPFAILAGMVVGYFINQWRLKNLKTSQILIRASGLGAVLNIVVEWTSIGFLYSFAAIGLHINVWGWILSFWPWFVAFLPLAFLIGITCGFMTALLILKKIKMN